MRSRLALGVRTLAVLATLAVAACGGKSGPAADAGGRPDAAVDVAPDDGGDAAGDAIDCAAVCDRIAAICAGVSNIDENWLSICRQNCQVRADIEPDAARAEEACVSGAADCATAVLCSVDPLGGDR